MKIYSILYAFSPGSSDDGDYRAWIFENRSYLSKEDASARMKKLLGEILQKRKDEAAEIDPEWKDTVTFEDLKDIGYSWSDDLSIIEYRYESKYDDVKPEPKYSWTITETEANTP